MDSINPIYGTARNPHDINRSCGGSSGGEGGLVAAKCTPIGFGTDVGGSIRIPAAFCGVYGFKPTSQRVTYKGITLPVKYGTCPQGVIIPTTGPLGKSFADIKVASELMFKSNEIDPFVPPLPFDHATFNEFTSKKLRIGYFDDLPLFPSTSSVKRGVNLAVEKLKK